MEDAMRNEMVTILYILALLLGMVIGIVIDREFTRRDSGLQNSGIHTSGVMVPDTTAPGSTGEQQ